MVRSLHRTAEGLMNQKIHVEIKKCHVVKKVIKTQREYIELSWVAISGKRFLLIVLASEWELGWKSFTWKNSNFSEIV